MSKKPNLLCIDDDKRILRSLKAMFRHSHNVYTTTLASEFLELLEKYPMHVAISDQRMPESSGVEFFELIRDFSPNTMRILLTGYADTDAVLEAINRGGVFRYMTKPWGIEELTNTVDQATKIALNNQIRRLTTPSLKNNDISIIYAETNETESRMFLRNFGEKYDVTHVRNVDDFKNNLKARKFTVAVIDMNFDGDDISRLLHQVKITQPSLAIVLLTRFNDTNTLISLMNTRDFTCVSTKPSSSKALENHIINAVTAFAEIRENPLHQIRNLKSYLNDELSTEEEKEIQALISECVIKSIRK